MFVHFYQQLVLPCLLFKIEKSPQNYNLKKALQKRRGKIKATFFRLTSNIIVCLSKHAIRGHLGHFLSQKKCFQECIRSALYTKFLRQSKTNSSRNRPFSVPKNSDFNRSIPTENSPRQLYYLFSFLRKKNAFVINFLQSKI